MDDFVTIVDSRPENEIPAQAIKQSKILFFKGLLLGIGFAICVGGIIQYIIKIYDSKHIQYVVYIWFNINEWTWIIGLTLLLYITFRNFSRKYYG